MICGSEGSKSRLAKAAGAEPCGQIRHLQVKKLKTPHVRNTFGSWDVQKVPEKLRCSFKLAASCKGCETAAASAPGGRGPNFDFTHLVSIGSLKCCSFRSTTSLHLLSIVFRNCWLARFAQPWEVATSFQELFTPACPRLKNHQLALGGHRTLSLDTGHGKMYLTQSYLRWLSKYCGMFHTSFHSMAWREHQVSFVKKVKDRITPQVNFFQRL